MNPISAKILRNKIPKDFKQTEFPADFAQAKDTINKALLSIYQYFYRDGLTNPSGIPFKINLNIFSGGLIGFKIKHFNIQELEAYGSNYNELNNRIQLLINAYENGKTKISNRACCILAEYRGCVCAESFECPIHNITCYGSHD